MHYPILVAVVVVVVVVEEVEFVAEFDDSVDNTVLSFSFTFTFLISCTLVVDADSLFPLIFTFVVVLVGSGVTDALTCAKIERIFDGRLGTEPLLLSKMFAGGEIFEVTLEDVVASVVAGA